ncbi:MAG: tRNA (N6-threonylcarbamoyladenosine(37)-N6)-methyltransferase TrmO [Syntrophomonadaceae bacterium]|nr:tRNA (N6-threonylcarbamoyladenosine(37)-N6)-methyltransferase TrmO [Syntrophomonadaceae bacterium]
MEGQISIALKPIGVVRSEMDNPADVPLMGKSAVVEVFPEYSPALLRIEENSHLWLLLWFHQSNRSILKTVPQKVNPNLPEFGVFGLRSPNRPNPIALTLVHLDAVEGNRLTVSGMDAVDGTPVLDIKSYYEGDIIFSPRTPYIWALDPVMRRDMMIEEAIAHHQEACVGLYLAVRMALVADRLLGQLNTPDLNVTVTGSPCLADTLQGLTRARLANPARFIFREDESIFRSIWEKPGRRLTITARQEIDMETFAELADDMLLKIELEQL